MQKQKTRKPTRDTFQAFLYNDLKFSWYQTGIVKNTANKKYGEYWKGDSLTDIQKKQLVERFGKWVEFLKAQSQYAPEQIKPLVILRSTN
jgi:hypothetical protein